MDTTLQIGNEYSKEEIEVAFETNFGARIKGITQRRLKNGDPCVLLFATAKGAEVYGDTVDGDVFYYKGEGLDGDQKITTANKALLTANRTGLAIFAFRQHGIGGKFEYLGLVSVLDWAYVDYQGRKVYEFKMQQQHVADVFAQMKTRDELLTTSVLPEPQLTGSGIRVVTRSESIVRDNAFKIEVRRNYNDTCAVCGSRRYTHAKYPEVQAAHIFPKEKNGSDDLRNGVALCRLHHWAFDGGLMAISDKLEVLVREEIKNDENYKDIAMYDGKKIRKPVDHRYSPVPLYLAEHRHIHGF